MVRSNARPCRCRAAAQAAATDTVSKEGRPTIFRSGPRSNARCLLASRKRARRSERPSSGYRGEYALPDACSATFVIHKPSARKLLPKQRLYASYSFEEGQREYGKRSVGRKYSKDVVFVFARDISSSAFLTHNLLQSYILRSSQPAHIHTHSSCTYAYCIRKHGASERPRIGCRASPYPSPEVSWPLAMC